MRTNYKGKNPKQLYRTNHQINAKIIRLLDDEGKQIDILDLSKALNLAQEQELDLVEVAPRANPPVVKLIDYNKFLFQLKKKKQEEKKKNIVSETKEIRMGPFIGTHDLEIKLSRAREFFNTGDKVRFVIKFSGREITKQNLGRDLMNKIIDILKEEAKVEREMHMEGRRMVMIMSKLK